MRRLVLRFGVVLGLSLLLSVPARAALRVAVADSFYEPLKLVAERYQKLYQQPITLVPGPAGDLFDKISQGAPFDLFFSTDIERPRQLILNGRGDADSFLVYAMGELALWCPNQAQPTQPADLAQAGTLAIADPQKVPYGAAAQRLLQAVGLWESLRTHIQFHESTAEVLRAVRGGQVSCGFVAYNEWLALPAGSRGKIWREPKRNDTLLKQAAIVMSNSPNNAAARQFLVFLQTPEMHQLIEDQGYRETLSPLLPPPLTPSLDVESDSDEGF